MWEYKRKGKHRTLDDAYRQLCQYREALENPPLLIVSDIARTEVRTNFTGLHEPRPSGSGLHCKSLPHGRGSSAKALRRVFTDPDSFKPAVTPESITAEIAGQFAALADSLRKRGHDPHDAAHFLMKCMFCLFAEDVGLLCRQCCAPAQLTTH